MTRLIDGIREAGVGTRTAQRFAFHILRSSEHACCAALADTIRALKAALRLCSVCNNITDATPA